MDDLTDGLLLCARYALSPNFFGYCGPAKSASLIDHLKENIADKEIEIILSQFETLYPYLQLIAYKNRLPSSFSKEVVEAYWLGNHLLKPLSTLEFQAFTQEKLFSEKKIPKNKFFFLKSKINRFAFLPHHSFHVFNIFKNASKINDSILSVMDNCRISWGKIVDINNHSKMKNLLVETRSLLIENNKLILSQPVIKEIKIDYQGKSFINDLKNDQWVSFHWGYFCDKLTKRQQKNLEYYTIKAIDFYNYD